MRKAKHGEQIIGAAGAFKIGEVISFGTFRAEMVRFLTERNIDASVASDEKKWSGFLALYTRVIEDSPLRIIWRSQSFYLPCEQIGERDVQGLL